MNYNFQYTSCAKPLHQQIEKYNLLYARTFIYMLEKERVALNTLITGNRFLSHENYNSAIQELDYHLRSHLEKQNAVRTFPKPKIKKKPKKEIILSQIKL